MTVQELIDALMKVSDKTKRVDKLFQKENDTFGAWTEREEIDNIEETDTAVEVW